MKNTKINLNKLSAVLIILLIFVFIAPLSTTTSSNGNGSSQEDQIDTANKSTNSTSTPNTDSDSNQGTNATTLAPNISNDVKQYNQTNVTPKNNRTSHSTRTNHVPIPKYDHNNELHPQLHSNFHSWRRSNT